MRIGCPKESKQQEFRVGLTPRSVATLVEDGHEVWMEHNAGIGIGCDDASYRKAGATIADNIGQLFEAVELVVKVKEPNAEECRLLRPEQTLFTYLHLAASADLTHALMRSQATCIAYETVTSDEGGLPLLMPMSEIAGRVSVQEAAVHLEKHRGGMGVLLSGATGVEPCKVIVIGGGVVGSNAARVAAGLGADVTILDRSEEKLKQLGKQFGKSVKTTISTPESIAELVVDAHLVVGAVLLPGGKATTVLPSALVKKMRPGSVIADVAIDQGGCCENSRPTTHQDPVFTVDGVIHYCVANIPGAVPVTASEALNLATLPCIRTLADEGIEAALQEDSHLRNGLNVYRGKLTRPEIGKDLGIEATAAQDLLGS